MHTSFDIVPLKFVPVLLIFIFLIAFEIGYRLGKRTFKSSDKPKDSSIANSVAAILGLLAFMLAFTFGMAGSRFETRRNIVVEEANAIGTTYLRSEFLQEPNRSTIQNVLRSYVDLRVAGPKSTNLDYVIKKSEDLQDALWKEAIIVAKENPHSVMAALFVSSLNELIDIHAKRVMIALFSRIPVVIWMILIFLGVLSMGALGYLSGLAINRNLIINLTLILAFASVIYLIADIDRPGEGELIVSQQSMVDLQKKIAL